MKTSQQIITLLARKKPEWEQRFQLKSLALFGSYARGDQAPESDIDILVEVDPRIGLDFVVLANDIESTLEQHVDVISKGALKPRHWEEIEQDLIYV